MTEENSEYTNELAQQVEDSWVQSAEIAVDLYEHFDESDWAVHFGVVEIGCEPVIGERWEIKEETE